jgi:hypothetical protein
MFEIRAKERAAYAEHCAWYKEQLATMRAEVARLRNVARAQSAAPDEGTMLQ